MCSRKRVRRLEGLAAVQNSEQMLVPCGNGLDIQDLWGIIDCDCARPTMTTPSTVIRTGYQTEAFIIERDQRKSSCMLLLTGCVAALV